MRKSPKNLPEGVPLWVLPLGGHYHPPSNASVAPPRKGCHPMQLNFPEDAADSLPPQPIPLGQKAGGSKGAEVKAERFYFRPLRRRSRNQEVPGESLVTFFSQESHPGAGRSACIKGAVGAQSPHFGERRGVHRRCGPSHIAGCRSLRSCKWTRRGPLQRSGKLGIIRRLFTIF